MRILIATVTCGSGHVQAATALEEVWKQACPHDKVKRVDVLDFTPKFYRQLYVKGYVKVIEHAPDIYGHYFRKTDDPKLIKKMTALRRISAKWMSRPFIRYLEQFRPHAVVCTHFLPLEIMGSLKKDKSDMKFPHVACVVTDFQAHALWTEPCVDLYCVATDDTLFSLVARDVDPAKIRITGIPVSTRFSRILDLNAICRKLGLRDDMKIVLVLGGGFGIGPLEEIILAESPKMMCRWQLSRQNESFARLSSRDYIIHAFLDLYPTCMS